jgi:hypothetical protein
MTLVKPLNPKKTKCLPCGERNEQMTASLSSSNVDLPCLGTNHGVEFLTKANHLRSINQYQRAKTPNCSLLNRHT